MHGEDQDDFDARPEDEPMRGWVPPDDRLWLHPSERASAASAGIPGPVPASPPQNQRVTWVIGGLAVCIVVTLIVGGMAVATANDSAPTSASSVLFAGVPTTEVDLSHLANARRMQSVASTATQSTVALVVSKPTRTTVGTGVVAEAGGIIVALQPTVADARSITVVEPDGTRQPAVVVGSDPTTGIVVLRTADDLPVAPFTTADPATGSVAVALSEQRTTSTGRPIGRVFAGTVLSSGTVMSSVTGAGDGDGGGLCVTTVAAPLGVEDLGSPLIEPSGSVVGIFSSVVGSGRSRTSVFLPAGLVRAVAEQIVSHGSVDHGSLDAAVVDPSDLPSGAATLADSGAVVRSVAAGGSADQAGLRPGDRIIAVDAGEVRSVAELTTRLYAEPPGSELSVRFVRGGRTPDTTVVLGDR